MIHEYKNGKLMGSTVRFFTNQSMDTWQQYENLAAIWESKYGHLEAIWNPQNGSSKLLTKLFKLH